MAAAALAVDAPLFYSWAAAGAICATALPLALRPADARPPAAADGERTADRALHVALATVSFLPYINWASFAALAALDRAKGTGGPPPARAAAAAALHATPLLLLALTGDARAALAATFLTAAHFQAERVLRSVEAADAAAAASDNDAIASDAADDDALLAAAAAAADRDDLARWDARLALARARRPALAALAARAGVRAGSRATKADLAAALAEAAGLEAGAGGVTPPAPWLVAELAAAGEAEVAAAAARAAARRRGRAKV